MERRSEEDMTHLWPTAELFARKGYDSNREYEMAVKLIKAYQQLSSQHAADWTNYCDATTELRERNTKRRGKEFSGLRDPGRHDRHSLNLFMEQHQQEILKAQEVLDQREIEAQQKFDARQEERQRVREGDGRDSGANAIVVEDSLVLVPVDENRDVLGAHHRDFAAGGG